MFTLNEALKIAGMPQSAKHLTEQTMKQVEGALRALIQAGALEDRNGLEWVETNDDDDDVIGPDGSVGDFNDSKYSRATKDFDPKAVLVAARFIWFVEGLISGSDVAFIKKAAVIAEEHFTKSMWDA